MPSLAVIGQKGNCSGACIRPSLVLLRMNRDVSRELRRESVVAQDAVGPARVVSLIETATCTRGECAWLPAACRRAGNRAQSYVDNMIFATFPTGDCATSREDELCCHMAVYHQRHCASSAGRGTDGTPMCSAADFVRSIIGVDETVDSGEIARAMASAADDACTRATAADKQGLKSQARAMREDARRYAALATAQLSAEHLQSHGL